MQHVETPNNEPRFLLTKSQYKLNYKKHTKIQQESIKMVEFGSEIKTKVKENYIGQRFGMGSKWRSPSHYGKFRGRKKYFDECFGEKKSKKSKN